ncbi:MAG: SDR family oxidoreductase [Marinilabiliales bacterium]
MQNNVLKNTKVLVTGGAGFIGSNLVEKLLELDNYVVCLDNFSTGSPDNLEEFIHNPNFELISGDIRDLETCRNACENIKIVFHQAALGSIPRSIDNPKETNDTNIGGFLNMLLAAKEKNVERFIYASSSSVYGDNERLPKIENETGVQLSPYAITKYVNELYANNFHYLYGTKCIGLRYFNVFGPKQNLQSNYASVIPKFIKAILNNENPVIYGDGSQTRDFTYVDNVVNANIAAATTDNPEVFKKIFNIACGHQISLNKLIEYLQEIVSEYFNKNIVIEPEYKPPRKGDIKHSLASIENAKDYLNYKPHKNIKEDLQKTFLWFVKNYNKNV